VAGRPTGVTGSKIVVRYGLQVLCRSAYKWAIVTAVGRFSLQVRANRRTSGRGQTSSSDLPGRRGADIQAFRGAAQASRISSRRWKVRQPGHQIEADRGPEGDRRRTTTSLEFQLSHQPWRSRVDRLLLASAHSRRRDPVGVSSGQQGRRRRRGKPAAGRNRGAG